MGNVTWKCKFELFRDIPRRSTLHYRRTINQDTELVTTTLINSCSDNKKRRGENSCAVSFSIRLSPKSIRCRCRFSFKSPIHPLFHSLLILLINTRERLWESDCFEIRKSYNHVILHSLILIKKAIQYTTEGTFNKSLICCCIFSHQKSTVTFQHFNTKAENYLQ